MANSATYATRDTSSGGDDMIVYISDPKNSIRELLNLINSFSAVSGYKLKQIIGLSLHKE